MAQFRHRLSHETPRLVWIANIAGLSAIAQRESPADRLTVWAPNSKRGKKRSAHLFNPGCREPPRRKEAEEEGRSRSRRLSLGRKRDSGPRISQHPVAERVDFPRRVDFSLGRRREKLLNEAARLALPERKVETLQWVKERHRWLSLPLGAALCPSRTPPGVDLFFPSSFALPRTPCYR